MKKYTPRKRPAGGTITIEAEIKLTAKAEAFNLAIHGTAACALTPNAIIQAAESDLRAKDLNARIRAERKRPKHQQTSLADEPLRPYALGHVVDYAATPADLIKKAIDSRASVLCLGQVGGERIEAQRKLPLSTLRVYQDADLLAAALAEAQRREAASVAAS